MTGLNAGSDVLVCGASQGIGLEFVRQLLVNPSIDRLYATYRSTDSALLQIQDPRLHCLSLDITQQDQVAALATTIGTHTKRLDLLINCVGMLHDGDFQPEKSLRQIDSDRLLRYFQVNSIGSILLARYFQPFLKHDDRAVFATLSAKVGSIGDNELGGWYGYRASKAALNMLMRNTAIEFRRSCPKAIVAMLHPGTTDTKLSQPFQKFVATDKLFTTERSVSQLLGVIEGLSVADSGAFFSWDGSRLPW
jgi:NAD(P)-dependent dehydrogenase (short-subunit alcohol dehydrogenase family)